ncbi:hypothetical protein BB560_004045 [Smittium megazygosporum]|uniref:Glycoside hydrolase family 19 catalytic domain-containing protein n=1 Tax=Smittium megazygosporum TaxID=133381 RepID=A0A2T9ZAE4_9FUNG|nr:hypothetical protein BB560_004045 [Smittium megazygosporum]
MTGTLGISGTLTQSGLGSFQSDTIDEDYPSNLYSDGYYDGERGITSYTEVGTDSIYFPQETGGSIGDVNLNCGTLNRAVLNAGYQEPNRDQCGAFLKGLPVGQISSNMEAAMFLAQILWESDGLRAKEEYYCQTNDCSTAYSSALDLPGKVYSGRGYIQLTWASNYQDASMALFGDDRLLQDPDQVSANEDIAWAVSFWYWRDRVRTDPRVAEGLFGVSTNLINGALECRGDYSTKAAKRFEIYKAVLQVFDPEVIPIETGCYN